ncbi:MAG TPA: ABC transporter ATP-binding protein [Actinopolymorphaceae bacterium]|jgi:ABC-2 type transport system ATP-binding protein
MDVRPQPARYEGTLSASASVASADASAAPQTLARAAIEARALVKSYQSLRVVDELSLRVEAGEVVALLGPNGAGKSTTIDMLLGLVRPDHGTVSIFGREPAAAIAAGHVGAMLQAGALPTDVKVREIVEAFATLHKKPLAVDEVLERAGVAPLADRWTTKLSGGEAQRVRFALALVPDPDLLILDEPTAGMDVESRRAFWSTIRDLATDGRTILFATHYLEEADTYADRVVVMQGGRLIADGTAAAIKQRVSDRVVSARIPGRSIDPAHLKTLPGVSGVELSGERVTLRCHDSDAALRALVGEFAHAHDIEVSSAGLETAFLSLIDERSG